MTAIKAAQVQRFVDRPDVTAGIFLVYGSDTGRVHEVAQHLVRLFSAGDDTGVVILDAAATEPAQIVAEALSPTLFGGRRVVRVRGAGKELTTVLTELAVEPREAVVILEAGNLTPRDPLRLLIESAPTAWALPCYADDARSLEVLIRAAFHDAEIRIEPDAVEALTTSLGSDREITRREIEKLILFAGHDGIITRETVDCLCVDNSAVALDGVLDATGTGHAERLQGALKRVAHVNGGDAQRVLSLALVHFMTLRRWRAALDAGKSVDNVLGDLRPKPHFSRIEALKQQLRLWREPALLQACGRLQQAVQDSRRNPALAPDIVERVLLSLAAQAAQL